MKYGRIYHFIATSSEIVIYYADFTRDVGIGLGMLRNFDSNVEQFLLYKNYIPLELKVHNSIEL